MRTRRPDASRSRRVAPVELLTSGGAGQDTRRAQTRQPQAAYDSAGERTLAIDYSKRTVSPSGGCAPVSLSKVTLTKSAPTVSLSKQGGGRRLHVNLNWSSGAAAPAKGGFLKRVLGAGDGIDLDLAYLFELIDG